MSQFVTGTNSPNQLSPGSIHIHTSGKQIGTRSEGTYPCRALARDSFNTRLLLPPFAVLKLDLADGLLAWNQQIYSTGKKGRQETERRVIERQF